MLSQDYDEQLSALVVHLGVDSMESLDSQEVEHLSSYLSSPLRLNLVSRSRLEASGLLTSFQVASLIDYRSRSGDVLSLTELSTVDGFSPEFVAVLAPFISLTSTAAVGLSSDAAAPTSNDLTLRTASRDYGSDDGYSYGAKYRLDYAEKLQFGLSLNRSYSSTTDYPETESFFVAYYGRGHLGKIVFGDYRLRYGQGLLLWSGFKLSTLSSVESFYYRPSGISPYNSYSGDGSSRGLAADFAFGRLSLGVSLGVDGLRDYVHSGFTSQPDLSLEPTLNLTYNAPNSSYGLTATSDGASIDYRGAIRGFDIFGEIMNSYLEFNPTALLGTTFKVHDSVKLALRATYSENEYNGSSGLSYTAGRNVYLAGKSGFGSSTRRHKLTLTASYTYFDYAKYSDLGPDYQLKLFLNYDCQLSSLFALSTRLNQRLRSAGETSKTELRVDLKFSNSRFLATLRADALYNIDFAWMSYLEGGYKHSRLTAYLRAGVFHVDNWNDRIYVYERDAPGSYNVPALYGRGVWAAGTITLKLTSSLKAYFRVSTLQYPFVNIKDRTPKTELKAQLNYVF